MSTLFERLAKFQSELVANGGVKYDSEVNFSGRKFKYASLSAVLSAVLPLLAKNNLSISQIINGEHLITILADAETGQTLVSRFKLPNDFYEFKPQDIGSRLTYMKRYSICGILGVSADEDQDQDVIAYQQKPATPKVTPNPSLSTQEIDEALKAVNLDYEVKESEGKKFKVIKASYDQLKPNLDLIKSLGFKYNQNQRVWYMAS